jgi:hypothetical protein
MRNRSLTEQADCSIQGLKSELMIDQVVVYAQILGGRGKKL